MKMTKDMLPSGTTDALADDLSKVYEKFDTGAPKFTAAPLAAGSGVFKLEETPQNKMLRQEVMKAVLKPVVEQKMNKAINTASNLTPYDLRAPALHLVPWLSPIRESLPRIHRPASGTLAHWKSIIANSNSYTRGGMPACPWINEGQRAPIISVTALNASATYASMGVDGNVT